MSGALSAILTIMNFETLQRRVNDYEWWQTVPLPQGVSTPGNQSIRHTNDKVVEVMNKTPFTGRRVIEIGCRDGLFSFEAERLGASEVIGIDHKLSRGAVDLLIPALGSKVKMVELNMFDPRLTSYGNFDVIIFAGVLYHLRYPFWAFRVVRDLLSDGGTMILETACFKSDESSPLLYCPVAQDSPYEPTSVSFFNERGLRDTLQSMGFNIVSFEWVGTNEVPVRRQIKTRALQIVSSLTRLLGSFGIRTAVSDRWILRPIDAYLARKWIGRCISVCTAPRALADPGVSAYWDGIPTGQA